MKRKNKIIFGSITGIIVLLLIWSFSLLFRIEACWYSDSKKHHLVFYDGKVYIEGGIPGCLGFYKKGEFEAFGEYKKDNDGYFIEIEGEKSRAYPGVFNLRIQPEQPSPPLILKRDWDPVFHSKTMKYLRNKTSNGENHRDCVQPHI